jgi:hypothetical protein
MNNDLIRAFLESSLVNAQARMPAKMMEWGMMEGRPTHNGDKLAQDVKTLLKLMTIEENK